MTYIIGIVLLVVVICIGIIYSFKLFKTVGRGLGKSNKDKWGMNYTDKEGEDN